MDIHEFIEFAIANHASHIYLQPGYPPAIRQKGNVIRLKHSALSGSEVEKLLSEILDKGDQGRCVYSFKDEKFLVQLFRVNGENAATLSAMPSRLLSLEELRAPDFFYDIAERAKGLVLINGYRGSGHTTHRAAVLQHIVSNTNSHIVAVGEICEEWGLISSVSTEKTSSILSCIRVGEETGVTNYDKAIEQIEYITPDVVHVVPTLDRLPSPALRRLLEIADDATVVLGRLPANSAQDAIEKLIWSLQHPDREAACNKIASALKVSICQTMRKEPDESRSLSFEILKITPDVQDAIRTQKFEVLSKFAENRQLPFSK